MGNANSISGWVDRFQYATASDEERVAIDLQRLLQKIISALTYFASTKELWCLLAGIVVLYVLVASCRSWDKSARRKLEIRQAAAAAAANARYDAPRAVVHLVTVPQQQPPLQQQQQHNYPNLAGPSMMMMDDNNTADDHFSKPSPPPPPPKYSKLGDRV